MTAASGPRVLLVDDNDDILKRAVAALAHECVVVGTVNDGRTVLDAVATLQPDVIVLDVSMGETSGFEVAQRLRAAGSSVSIVFLTVHDEEEMVRAAHACGAMGYVVKRRLTFDLLTAVTEAHAGRPYLSQW